MTAEPVTFDLAALYRAVDSKRLRRRLKWPDVAAEAGLTLATIRRAQTLDTMEADGVLAMVRWLGVAPETFVRPPRDGPIPEYMDVGTVWRVDTAALHARLEAVRIERNLTWAGIARALGPGVSTASLTRLAKGGRVAIGLVAAVAAWLDAPIQAFTRLEKAPAEPDDLTGLRRRLGF